MSDSETSPIVNATHPTFLRPFTNGSRPSVAGALLVTLGCYSPSPRKFSPLACIFRWRYWTAWNLRRTRFRLAVSLPLVVKWIEPSMTGHYNQNGMSRSFRSLGQILIRPRPSCSFTACADNGLQLMTRRTIIWIPDPVAGPEAVRTLLVVRGTSGAYRSTHTTLNFQWCFHRQGCSGYVACIGHFNTWLSQMR